MTVETTDTTVVLKPGSILTDSSTVWPAVLDPTWTATTQNSRLPAWTMVWSTGEKFYNSTTQDPRVGYDGWSATTKKSRVYYRFDTSTLAGKKIDTVTFEHSLDHTVNQNCSLATYGPNVQIHRTQEFNSSTTWAAQPAVIGSTLGADNTAVGHDSYCPGTKLQVFTLGGIRQDLEDGIDLLKLRMKSEDEADRNGWRTYINNDTRPVLRVVYRDYPSTPTGLSITHSNNWGAEGWYTRRLTPAVSVTASQPNGGNLKARFQIVEGATQRWLMDTTPVPSSPRWFSRIVPAGTLVNGHTYQLRAWSVDPNTAGDIYSKGYASLNFTVDITPPGPPTITVPGDLTPPVACIIGQPCSFTVSGGGGDVAWFYCGLNTDAPLQCATTSGGAARTYTISPKTFGPAWFTARAVDKAGNLSSAAVKTLKVESSRLSHAWALDGNGDDLGEHGGVLANIYPISPQAGTTWGAGPYAALDPTDRALEFDGTDDYAATDKSSANTPATADSFDLRTDRDFSISAWVRLDGTPDHAEWAVSSPGAAGGPLAAGSVMALGYDPAAGGRWVFQVVSPSAVVGQVDPDDARLVDTDAASEPVIPPLQAPIPGTLTTSASAPVADTASLGSSEPGGAPGTGWVHLVGIFNDRTSEEAIPGQPPPLPELTLWVNGRQVATVTLPETVLANQPRLFIGAAQVGGNLGGFWDGAVNDLRVFPGVLDRGQVLRIASERRP